MFRQWLLALCVVFFTLSVARADGALMEAAQLGQVTEVERLLESGEEIDSRDNDGYTALMWSARRGQLQVVQYLVKQGADVTLLSSSGYSAYDLAVNFGHYGTAEYLEQQPGATAKSRKRQRRNAKASVYNTRLGECPEKINVAALIKRTLYGRNWDSFEDVDVNRIAATYTARGYSYDAEIDYDPVTSGITLSYAGPDYGSRKALIKAGKLIRKSFIKSCRASGAFNEK